MRLQREILSAFDSISDSGHVSSALLQSRDSSSSSSSSSSASQTRTKAVIIFAVITGILLCGTLAAFFTLRYLRIRHPEPKYVPTAFLKRKWQQWTPSSEKRRQFSALQDRRSIQMARTPSPAQTLTMIRHSMGYDGSLSAADLNGSNRNTLYDNEHGNVDGVDRRTSQRSVITLPAYSADVRPTEKVMGKEGERAGIDTVVEFPETTQEEEDRREEEMESLYQIRRVRREERADREERRRLRREARARGDTAALEELRLQSRLAREEREARGQEELSEALIREHRSRERGRRVSSVSYMDLGLARHDGSRVRADSNESSDHRPLLDSAASIGGASSHSRPRSGSRPQLSHNPNSSQGRLRNMSVSSLSRFVTPDISDDERSSIEFEMIPTPGGSGSRPRNGSPASRPGSRLRFDSADLGDGSQLSPSFAPSQESGRRASGGIPISANHRPPPDYEDVASGHTRGSSSGGGNGRNSPVETRRSRFFVRRQRDSQHLHQQQQQQQQQEQDQSHEQQTHSGQTEPLTPAPPYESPVSPTNRNLDTNLDSSRSDTLTRLPSIKITPFSPVISDQ